MLVTNKTTSDIYFGPLHLEAGIGSTLEVDDTSATSLYLLNDAVADALNNAYAATRISVSDQAEPFPRPTGTPQLLHGLGDPEGMVYAAQGSVYMRRDGYTSNGGGLYVKMSGVTSSTQWTDLATASGATAVLPPGLVMPFAGTTTPAGWLACDGSAVSRSTYSLLFTAIGTTYGSGDGTSTFNLPDLQGRVPVGHGTHGDVASLGLNDSLAVGSRTPRHNTTLSGVPGLTGSPGLIGAPSLTGSPGLSGSPGISDPGHSHGQGPLWGGGSSSWVLEPMVGFGNGSHYGDSASSTDSASTGISATIGSLAATIGSLTATIGSLGATIGSLAATIGSLFAGPGGTRPTDTPAYLVVNYVIKT